RQIVFRGNKAFSTEELLKVMRSKRAHSLSWLTSTGYFREELVEADVALLDQFYRDHGYIDVVVSRPIITISQDRRFVYLSFQIKEGEQYRVGRVDVTGELLFPREEHLKELKLTEGMVFSQSLFEKDRKRISSRYTDIGYAFAEVKPNIKKREGERIVDITYDVRRGRLAYIERIDIVGNERTRDKVIRRELTISEGDLYSGPRIRRSRAKLMRLGYFESVEIKTERGSSPSAVRLVVQVKERMTGSFLVGIGFSSIENIFGTVQISVANLFGTGQKASVNAEIGEVRKDVSLNYLYPYIFDTKFIFGVYLLYSDRNYESFDRLERSVRVRVGYPLGWDITGYMSYGVHLVEVSDFSRELRLYMQLEEGKTETTSLEWSLVRNTVDNPYFPTKGSDNRITVEWASDRFGGNVNFLKYLGQTRWYYPVTVFGTKWMPVFMFNGEGGYAQSLDGEKIPLAERFFLGGLNSVRGFRYRTLGPTEADVLPLSSSDPTSRLMDVSVNIGGDKYVQGNIELMFPLVPSMGIRGLLFYDIGNAFGEGESIELDLLRQSWGFGIRWFSPIGPLRFEWGFPLHPRENEERQVFEFGVGSFF
ncbi:MAG TPA: outer membrane protein assembly factor BamA, partial [Proteobacteria bacterium]|nr:outer membrane protein assembly factor BamA [Pseudomonadota bacterium]